MESKKNKILTKLVNSEMVNNLIEKMCYEKEYRNDLRAELYLHLAELPNKQIIQMQEDNKLLNYISVYIKRQIHSSTSPFYRKYKLRKKLDLNAVEQQEYKVTDLTNFYVIEETKRFLKTIHWYNSYIFKLYYFENKSYRDIQEMHTIILKQGIYRISYTKARLVVLKVLKELKDHLKKKNLI